MPAGKDKKPGGRHRNKFRPAVGSGHKLMGEGKAPAYFADPDVPVRVIANWAQLDLRALQDRPSDVLTGFEKALAYVTPRLIDMMDDKDPKERARGVEAVASFQKLRLEARQIDMHWSAQIVQSHVEERTAKIKTEVLLAAQAKGESSGVSAAGVQAIVAAILAGQAEELSASVNEANP